MPHPFLSPEWIAAAREIREKRRGDAAAITESIRINQVITDVPFGDGTVRCWFDTSSGFAEIELGELDQPDVTITTDYETARAIFVDQDPTAAMQAFMAGKIKVQGDMMKLIALQSTLPHDDAGRAIAAEIKAATAPTT